MGMEPRRCLRCLLTHASKFQVPMNMANPARAENHLPTSDDAFLPLPGLTASTLLGGASSDREMAGQLYASQLASLIASRSPEESRTVLVGLGLNKAEVNRTQFFDLLELATRCI